AGKENYLRSGERGLYRQFRSRCAGQLRKQGEKSRRAVAVRRDHGSGNEVVEDHPPRYDPDDRRFPRSCLRGSASVRSRMLACSGRIPNLFWIPCHPATIQFLGRYTETCEAAMKKYGRFAALIVIILGTLIWLATAGVGESKSYYKTIAEIRQLGPES